MTTIPYIDLKTELFLKINLTIDIDSMKEMCTIPINQKRTGF